MGPIEGMGMPLMPESALCSTPLKLFVISSNTYGDVLADGPKARPANDDSTARGT